MVQFCGGRSAPIVKPSEAGWSKPALEKYLGPDPADWRQYDTCLLLEDGHRFPEFLVDQGAADSFLELLVEAAKRADQKLVLNMREGYDHSYNFISSFMDEHLRWHAARLK
jgi:S-formylglutathione hydrolase